MEDDQKPFGLCLSGGGFRATLYHLGVISFLRDAGALKDITHIFSVSGGSILAAHLVLNWEKYNGSDEDFEEIAGQVIQLTKSDVRGRVIRKWIFSWLLIIIRPLIWLLRKFRLLKKPDWRITNLLASIYSKFYRYKDEQGNWQEAKLADFKGKNSARPNIYILSTSVTTGRLCSFDNSGVTLTNEICKNPDDKEGNDNVTRIDSDIFPVGTAVAASSAFPPVFSPVAITKEMFQASEKKFPYTEYLTDGGVYDNLGIRSLILLQEAEESIKFGRVFVSDAGTAFDSKLNEPFSFILTLSIRASNVLMMRVGSLEYLGLENQDQFKVAICKIRDEIRDKGTDKAHDFRHSLNIDTQRAMECIRTDLNEFSFWEINVLTQHGYATARKAFISEFGAENSQDLKEKEPWKPKVTSGDWQGRFDLETEMQSAKRRKWGLWSPRDSSSWLTLGVLFLAVIIPFGLSSFGVFKITSIIYEKDENTRRTNEEIISFVKSIELNEPDDIETLKKANNILQRNLETLSETEPEDQKTDEAIKLFSGKILTDLFNKRKEAVVKIIVLTPDNQSRFGSGFFVRPDGHILTADYVPGEPGGRYQYTVEMADGTLRTARLVDKDSSKKLALLKIAESGSYQYFNFRKDANLKDSSAIGIGYLADVRGVTSKLGTLKEDTAPFFQIQFNENVGSTGFGGAPILDTSGNVVGVYYKYEQPVRRCILASEAEAYVLEQLGN